MFIASHYFSAEKLENQLNFFFFFFCDIDSTWTENVSRRGGLDEKCPYRLIYCSMVLSPVGGAVWEVMEPLGSRVLLEELHHWGWDLRIYSLVMLTSSGLRGLNPGYSNSMAT